MANLWIGWLMEFIGELFLLLHQQNEVKVAVNGAYTQTLKSHHNFFQSTVFYAATRNLPTRQKFYETLRGSGPNVAPVADLDRDIGDFAACAKAIADFCGRMATEVSALMEIERKKLGK